ncbi:MAG: hypothetical protein ACRC51_04095 [Cetobacterium sp.]
MIEIVFPNEIETTFSIEANQKEAQKLLTKAINRVLTKGVKELKNTIPRQYFISGEEVKKSLNTSRANSKNLTGKINVSGKVLGIERFKASKDDTGFKIGVNKSIGEVPRDGLFVRATRNFAGVDYSKTDFSIRFFKRKPGTRKIKRIYGASIPGITQNISLELDDSLVREIAIEYEKLSIGGK